MLRDEINTALKGAMKARDERRVSTLRLINAALKNADFEAQGRAKPVLSDEEILALLQKLIKQRQEAAELYDKAVRAELAAREREDEQGFQHRSHLQIAPELKDTLLRSSPRKADPELRPGFPLARE